MKTGPRDPFAEYRSGTSQRNHMIVRCRPRTKTYSRDVIRFHSLACLTILACDVHCVALRALTRGALLPVGFAACWHCSLLDLSLRALLPAYAFVWFVPRLWLWLPRAVTRPASGRASITLEPSVLKWFVAAFLRVGTQVPAKSLFANHGIVVHTFAVENPGLCGKSVEKTDK